MNQERFIMVDRFDSDDPWPYHVMDRHTGERFDHTDFRSFAEQRARELNENGVDY